MPALTCLNSPPASYSTVFCAHAATNIMTGKAFFMVGVIKMNVFWWWALLVLKTSAFLRQRCCVNLDRCRVKRLCWNARSCLILSWEGEALSPPILLNFSPSWDNLSSASACASRGVNQRCVGGVPEQLSLSCFHFFSTLFFLFIALTLAPDWLCQGRGGEKKRHKMLNSPVCFCFYSSDMFPPTQRADRIWRVASFVISSVTDRPYLGLSPSPFFLLTVTKFPYSNRCFRTSMVC